MTTRSWDKAQRSFVHSESSARGTQQFIKDRGSCWFRESGRWSVAARVRSLDLPLWDQAICYAVEWGRGETIAITHNRRSDHCGKLARSISKKWYLVLCPTSYLPVCISIKLSPMMFIVMHGGYLLSTGMYVLDGGYVPCMKFQEIITVISFWRQWWIFTVHRKIVHEGGYPPYPPIFLVDGGYLLSSLNLCMTVGNHHTCLFFQ